MSLGNALPFGLRDIQIVPYPSLAATDFGTTLVDLPNAQTFSFTEKEDYTELRGDDVLVTSHGQGAQLDCSLESGGISMDAYKAINGGQIIETGVTPNQIRRYRKLSTDQRPFFAVIGKAISDSGGDLHAVVYRARATGDIAGEFKDGEFFVPSADITGFPCFVAGSLGGAEISGALYDFVQHETIATIIAPVLDAIAAPTVDSLSDQAGPVAGGEIVTLHGLGYVGVVAVKFGTTAAADYEIVDAHTIVASAPAHAAGSVNVTVQNGTGTSPTGAQNAYVYS
jgi:hypothetical protein